MGPTMTDSELKQAREQMGIQGISNGDLAQLADVRPQVTHQIYAVKDSKANAFLTPIFATTDGVALRMLAAAVNDEKHEFARFAEDYALWRIGEFCEATGVIEGKQPEMLVHCSQLKEE